MAVKIVDKRSTLAFGGAARRGDSIQIDIETEGRYSVQLLDMEGKLLFAKYFYAARGATQTMLHIPASFDAGLYYIKLVNGKRQFTNRLVVV